MRNDTKTRRRSRRRRRRAETRRHRTAHSEYVFVYCVISVMCVFLCVFMCLHYSVWAKCRESCSTFARRERLIVHTHSTRAWLCARSNCALCAYSKCACSFLYTNYTNTAENVHECVHITQFMRVRSRFVEWSNVS